MGKPKPSDRELAAARLRSYRKRLRSNYKRSLLKARIELDAKHYVERLRSVQQLQAHATKRIAEEREKAAALAREVTKLTLRMEPRTSGRRWTLYATFDERFIGQAANLKVLASYALEMLCAKLQAELAQLDFSRLKPVALVTDARTGERRPIIEFYGDEDAPCP